MTYWWKWYIVFSINGWGCTSHINKSRNMIHKWDVKFDNKMCNAAENLLFYLSITNIQLVN